jgi:hypothetical protein
MKRPLLPLILFFPALLAVPAAQADDMSLTVKPVLCITDKRNPSCDMSFLVMWQSLATGYVQADFSFWMTGTDPETRLAQVDVEVLRMDSDDRRRKRRTRHVWDIN